MSSRRSYKIFTDGRKNMMTIPASSEYDKGDEVYIQQVGDFLLVMRTKRKDISFAEQGEVLRGVIEEVLRYYGVELYGSAMLKKVVESFDILQKGKE